MSDIDGQEFSSEVTEPAEAPVTEENHSTEEQSTANPYWGEVEKLTGPNVYRTIKPHLDKADAEANKRISALNERYKPWQAFADQGVTPDHVSAAFGYVQKLNDPEGQLEIYNALHSFLKENGRLPNEQELAEEVLENAEETDPREAEIQALQQRLEELQQFTEGQFSAQEQHRIEQEADAWADNEWRRITEAHPDLSKEDLGDVAQILAAQTNRGEAPDLDKAVAQFSAMRDRIRTAPRPGQFAPRLPSGPGGGTPQGGGIDMSKLTKAQRIELAAQTLQRDK